MCIYTQLIGDVYEKLEEYKPTKKRKMLLAFDDIIVEIMDNKKISPIVTEFILWVRKLNISIFLISQFYIKVLKL